MKFISLLLCALLSRQHSLGFSPVGNSRKNINLAAEKGRGGDGYDTASKGLVSSLTGIVNLVMGEDKADISDNETLSPAPKSPQALMKLIEEDYTEKNYLWTGDIHLPAFEPDCTFTDPTLSFTGTQKFVSNVKNLVPIVDFLTEQASKRNDGTGPQSKLLDISLNEDEGYVQTRWNMVGDLSRLPWKPAIDVIGRTKFWYNQINDDGYRVYFYDEEWELEAGTALLQLITPKGSIPNSKIEKSK